MFIRHLKINDVPFIYEWIKDPDIGYQFQFVNENIDFNYIERFVRNSLIDKINKHYAIANDNDEYLGTISLKNINYKNNNAEYAIALRKKAIGNNIASIATSAILFFAFEILHLKRVYLNVLSSNTRAIRFYEKYGFLLEGELQEHVVINNKYCNLRYYGIFFEQFIKKKNELDEKNICICNLFHKEILNQNYIKEN